MADLDYWEKMSKEHAAMRVDKRTMEWVPDDTPYLNNQKLVDRVGLVANMKIDDYAPEDSMGYRSF